MLSRILYKAIRGSRFTYEKSSFKNFRRYIEGANKDVAGEDLLCYMPQSEVLEFDHFDDKVQMISVTKCDGQEPTQEASLYCVFQALMKEQGSKRVTGALSYDLRTFEGFDATNVLGDVHTKIPFFSETGEDLATFRDRFDSCLAVYRKGIDLRWLATRKMGAHNAQVLSTRWNTLNFSVNYLGMALDLEDVLLNIKGIDFDYNFMNMFTYRDSMVCVIRQRILKDSSYVIQSKGATYCLQTSIE
ncbi:unnamed protein product [Cylicostephanus goldi]|uniref:Uncharacterized protein n=1 Tax=Cylicostephanus goldi TaxID=71465 RepID=A0A3P6SI04_CYLGO|nr:unnamed protein product [Cylicostephanus goldi]